jgi:4-hydroxy-4-methyl-2-oxoglutarate aldolase
MTTDPTPLLLTLGAATLAESGGRPLASGLRPVWSASVLAAPAFPVRCAAGDNLAIHHAVTRAPTGSALVVAVDGAPELGWWGEVLTIAAQARGLTGLAIDAHVRDTAAIAEHRFPVWARGVALPGAQKVASGTVGEAVTVRGALVEAGDWVVADGDGVVIVPGSALDDVLAAGRQRAAREAAMFEELRGGRTTVELLDLPRT